ncbi:MAG: molecular chaperone DnaJ [Myxococcota bacterium]
MRSPTYKLYEALSVTPGSDMAVVKKAWRAAARRLHPDRNPDNPNAKKLFSAASDAWAILSDPNKKALYDAHGDLAVTMNFADSLKDYKRSTQRKRDTSRDYQSRRKPRGAPAQDASAFPGAWGGGPMSAEREAQKPSGARANSPRPDASPRTPQTPHQSTTASATASGRPRATPGGHRPMGTAMPKRGTDLKFDAIIPLKTAALGGPWVLDIERPEGCAKCEGTGWRLAGRACTQCKGQGILARRASVTIRVPADTQNNRVITTRGEGAPGINGGEHGDLWTTVKVAPDPHFQRRGLDLWTDVMIPVDVAQHGGTVDVRNLHAVVTVSIPPSSRTGKVIRTKGAGIPGPRGRLPGDLHVRVVVDGG